MTLSLQKEKKIEPPRILIYGPPKMGKSTFGSLAPNPVFIQTEDGLGAIDVPSYPLANTYEQVLDYIGELCSKDHDFKTLVIDSLDWLERLIYKSVCRERNVKSIEDIGYGKGYLFALEVWAQFIDAVEWLRLNRDMTIVFIAHSHIKRYNNPETESYDRHQIKMHEKASEMLMEKCDMILFVNEQVITKKTQEGFKERNRALDSERILYTERRPSFVAGSRYNIPAEIPFEKDGAYWVTLSSNIPYFNQTKGE